MIKLSIVTPTLNRPNDLFNALQSLEGQTIKDFEWIIVDNGSSKNTIKTQKEIQQAASFPVHLMQETTKGPSACRTLGSSRASTDFVAYLDDDDELSTDAVEAWIDAIASTNADLVALSGVDRLYSLLGKDFIQHCDYSEADSYINNNIKKYLIPFRVTFARFAYRKSLIEQAGFWNTELRCKEDAEFLLRFLYLNPEIRIAKKGKYLYNKRKLGDKYIGEPFIRSMMASYRSMEFTVTNTPAKEIVTKQLAKEAHTIWLKASIFYPEVSEELKAFAEKYGVTCNDSRAKRKLLRILKAPFRRYPILNLWYKKIIYRRKLQNNT